jgi:hypothetical protein
LFCSHRFHRNKQDVPAVLFWYSTIYVQRFLFALINFFSTLIKTKKSSISRLFFRRIWSITCLMCENFAFFYYIIILIHWWARSFFSRWPFTCQISISKRLFSTRHMWCIIIVINESIVMIDEYFFFQMDKVIIESSLVNSLSKCPLCNELIHSATVINECLHRCKSSLY